MGAWSPPARVVTPRAALTLALVTAAVVALVGFGLLRGGGDEGLRSGASLPPPGNVKTPAPANRSFDGLTTFRGNESRSYYGEGPVPRNPVIRWRQPGEKMCMSSLVGIERDEWCGTGWTGQPNVIAHGDGSIEVREGAYDGAYHFVDGLTGVPVRPAVADAGPREGVGDLRIPTGSPCTTRAPATTTSGWWRSTGPSPRCSGS